MNDGQAATSAALGYPFGMVFMPDGSLCVASSLAAGGTNPGRVRCIDGAGIIRTIGGAGTYDQGVDGIPATDAKIGYPAGLALGADGSIYVAEESTRRIRRIAPNGTISTIAGVNNQTPCAGEGVAAASAFLSTPVGVAVDAGGRVYLSDLDCGNVRRLSPVTLGQDADVAGQIAVPSEDGREIYVFNELGRHLRTEDAWTGAVRFEFEYTNYEVASGVYADLLTEIQDRRGSIGGSYALVTDIDRDTDGTPNAIIAPFDQTTTLTITDGYLEGVSYPSSIGSYVLDYHVSGNGLLTGLTDPKGGEHSFGYSTTGLLETDRDPATSTGNPFRSLSSSVNFTNGVKTKTVTLTTAENVATDYVVVSSPDGTTTRQRGNPDGTTISGLVGSSNQSTVSHPDGTTRAYTPIADNRFGLAAPTMEEVLTLSGTQPKQLFTRVERTVSGGSGLQDFTTLTESRKIMLDPYGTGTREYVTLVDKTGSTHFIRETNPVSTRRIKRVLDSYGRVVQIAVDPTSGGAEVAPIDIEYDTYGRTTLVSQGTAPNNRQTGYAYDSSGYLQWEVRGTSADPYMFNIEYVRDDLGRVREVFRNTGSDGTQFKMSYDENSNLTGVDIPTGSPSTYYSHALPHTSTNLLDYYDPPNASNTVDYDYNLDRQLKKIDWPSGSGLDILYGGTTGKLAQKKKIGTSTVLSSYAYNQTTGKLSSITAGNIVTSYVYSGIQTNYDGLLGKLGTTWSSSEKDVTFTYDDYLHVHTEAVTGGQTITYNYDDDGLVTHAYVGSIDTLNLSNRSAQSGRLNSLSSAGVVTTSYGYDHGNSTFGDITSLSTTCAGSTCTQAANCGTNGECFVEDLDYDDLARIETRTDTVKSNAASDAHLPVRHPKPTLEGDAVRRIDGHLRLRLQRQPHVGPWPVAQLRRARPYQHERLPIRRGRPPHLA